MQFNEFAEVPVEGSMGSMGSMGLMTVLNDRMTSEVKRCTIATTGAERALGL